MKKHIVFIAILFAPFLLFAKRNAPQKVESLFIDKLEFRAEHFSYDKNNRPIRGGIIEVWNTDTSTKERIIIVYRTTYNILLEKDAQDVFITDMRLGKDGKTIVITDEQGRIFELNIKTYNIRKLK